MGVGKEQPLYADSPFPHLHGDRRTVRTKQFGKFVGGGPQHPHPCCLPVCMTGCLHTTATLLHTLTFVMSWTGGAGFVHRLNRLAKARLHHSHLPTTLPAFHRQNKTGRHFSFFPTTTLPPPLPPPLLPLLPTRTHGTGKLGLAAASMHLAVACPAGQGHDRPGCPPVSHRDVVGVILSLHFGSSFFCLRPWTFSSLLLCSWKHETAPYCHALPLTLFMSRLTAEPGQTVRFTLCSWLACI